MTLFLIRRSGECGRMEIASTLREPLPDTPETERAILDTLNRMEGVKDNPFTKAIII